MREKTLKIQFKSCAEHNSMLYGTTAPHSVCWYPAKWKSI